MSTLGEPGRLTSSTCPNCGGQSDGFTALDSEATPKAGDVAICLYCLTVLVYGGDPLRLRRPTGAERADLYADPEIADARRQAAYAQRVGGFANRRGLQ